MENRVGAAALRWLAAVLLGLIVVAGQPAPASAGDKTVSAAVARPVKDAQDLVKRRDYAAALRKMKEAAGVPGKSAYESFIVDEYTAFIAVQLKDYGEAAAAYERSLDSPFADAKDEPRRLKALVQLCYAAKDYEKTVKFARLYEQQAGADAEMQKLAVQALYLQGDYAGAEASAKALADSETAAGRRPDETVLNLWLSAAFKKNDSVGRREALTALVENFPSAAYWTDLLNLTERDIGRSDRLSLEVFRLRLAAGLLTSSEDYMEMAQIAIQLGLPGEAQSVMERGFAAKVLGGANKSRELRLLAMAKSQAASDSANLAPGAKSSAAEAALGEAYASYGKYGKAVALYRQALGGGSLPQADLVRLHLGQALLAQGDAAGAKKVFGSTKARPFGDLARIWDVVAGRKS
jgi:hypothetical protein